METVGIASQLVSSSSIHSEHTHTHIHIHTMSTVFFLHSSYTMNCERVSVHSLRSHPSIELILIPINLKGSVLVLFGSGLSRTITPLKFYGLYGGFHFLWTGFVLLVNYLHYRRVCANYSISLSSLRSQHQSRSQWTKFINNHRHSVFDIFNLK
jgi:hypothetical protein